MLVKTFRPDMTVIGLDKDYITYVGFLVILDVACCYLWLFTLHINIKMGNNSCKMLTSSGDRLYGKKLFTWLSLVMSMIVSFLCCPFSHEISWMRS